MAGEIGRHFKIDRDGERVRIFSLEGERLGGTPIVINQENERETQPETILGQIETLLSSVDSSLVDRIYMSNYVAMQLYLDGILKPTDFSNKIEDDNSLTILNVMVLGNPFALFIRDEAVVGREFIRLIGEDGAQIQ